MYIEESFINKCWRCVQGDKNTNSSIKPYLLSKIDDFDLVNFVRRWLVDERYLEVLDILQNYYEDKTADINPIMIGIFCSQAELLSIKDLYRLYKDSAVWKIPHSLLLNHIYPSEPVDLIGFYLWLSRYKATGASSPCILKKMWVPFSMGKEQFSILDVLEEQGIYCPSIKFKNHMYRWTDNSMPQRILSIGEVLITTYRIRALLQGTSYLPLYKYRFFP